MFQNKSHWKPQCEQSGFELGKISMVVVSCSHVSSRWMGPHEGNWVSPESDLQGKASPTSTVGSSTALEG